MPVKVAQNAQPSAAPQFQADLDAFRNAFALAKDGSFKYSIEQTKGELYVRNGKVCSANTYGGHGTVTSAVKNRELREALLNAFRGAQASEKFLGHLATRLFATHANEALSRREVRAIFEEYAREPKQLQDRNIRPVPKDNLQPVGDKMAKTDAVRVLTGGLDSLLGGKRTETVAIATVDLFRQLAQADRGTDSIQWRLGATTLTLSWDDGGTVRAAPLDKAGNLGPAFSLGTDAAGLLTRLADEIGTRTDAFGEFFGELLDALPRGNDEQASTASSLRREFCKRIIESVAGVPAHRLANVTTANLIDIAKNAVEQHRTGAVIGDGGVDGFAIVSGERELVEKCLDELETVMSRNYVASADAKELLEALKRDEAADDKVALPKNLNFRQKTGFVEQENLKPEELDAARQKALWDQRVRDFAADILLCEDPSVHDATVDKDHLGGQAVDEFADTLKLHAETVAKLVSDFKEDGDRALSALCDPARNLVRTLLEGKGPFGGLVAWTEAAREAEGGGRADRFDTEAIARLANTLKMKNDPKIQTKRFALSTILGATRLGVMKRFMDSQKAIADSLNAVFKPENVKDVTDFSDLGKMMENARKMGSDGYAGYVKNVLSSYFASPKLAGQDRLAMAAALFRYAPGAELEALQDAGAEKLAQTKMIAALLKGAGPLLQKMLQALDPKMFGESPIGDAIKDMKKNLAPIPEKVVKANLLDIVARSGGKISKIEAKKILGCASVGEAILCTAYGPDLRDEGRPIVVKILRPDALQRIGREKEILREAARKSNMEKSFQGQLDSILSEFDFTREAANIAEGQVYENRKAHPRVGAVKTIPLVEPSSGTLVMECAPGETVQDLFERMRATVVKDPPQNNREIKGSEKRMSATVQTLKVQQAKLVRMQRDLCDMAEQWVKEAFYGGGFFHGDLHAGNIMLDPEKGATMIDFGNVTKLTDREKASITELAAAASLYKTDNPAAVTTCATHFVSALRRLLPSSSQGFFEKEEARVNGMVGHVLKAGSGDNAGERILVILNQLERWGLEIPTPLYMFTQSQIRLDNSLNAVNAVLDKVNESIRELTNAINIPTLPFEGFGKARGALGTVVNNYHARQKILAADKKAAQKAVNAFNVAREKDAIKKNLNVGTVGENSLTGKFVDWLGDEDLTTAWGDLMEALNNPNVVDGLDQVKEAFAQKLAECEKRVIDTTYERIRNIENYGGKNLETFASRMGKVVKQNLVATLKRLPRELQKALS